LKSAAANFILIVVVSGLSRSGFSRTRSCNGLRSLARHFLYLTTIFINSNISTVAILYLIRLRVLRVIVSNSGGSLIAE